MQSTNNFRTASEIGGPVDISESYRWNVPVLTYGFDRSFLEFFGEQGVAAVEGAIQVLNDLPPASRIVLTNYPFITSRYNWADEPRFLLDLKTSALCSLVEQIGLAQPARNMFVVRRWDPFLTGCPYCYYEYPWQPGTIPFYILMRNFDPVALSPTTWLNGNLFSAEYIPESNVAYVMPFPVDPIAPFSHSVAEGLFQYNPFGFFFTNLTYDDVGGISFLLSATNVTYETLLPDVQSANPNRPLLNGAWRPGVEKITFVRQDYDRKSGEPLPMTFRYKDAYLTNGMVTYQNVKRVVTEPDFLFSAGDSGPQDVWGIFMYSRSGTSNWTNQAALNGRPGALGPGSIRPPVQIVFQKIGPNVVTGPAEWGGPSVFPLSWASFEGSTNAPTIYPAGMSAASNYLTVWLQLYGEPNGSAPQIAAYDWNVPVSPGGLIRFQTSTNLVNWETQATITNNGTIVDWQHYGTQLSREFFRAVAQ